MQITIDEALIRSLPLPLAELYHSVQRPYRKPLEQFLSTCQLWEAGLKLLGAVAVAEYARLDHKDPAIQKRLTNLARPALGHWWEFVKTLLPVLAKASPERFQQLNKQLLESAVHDMPQAAALDVALQQEHDARPVPARNTVRLKDLFDRLIWLRNQEVGHGALGQRKSSFYAQLSQKLLPGVVEVLARLDVLTGRHLIYIADVRRLPNGQWSVDRYELTGETGRILDSLSRPGSEVALLPCPGQIYLQDGSGKPTLPMVSLHPLVIFDPDEQEVMFLNERRGRGRLEYLCYSSGRTVDLKEVEQQELLSRLLDMEVDTNRLAEWAKKAEKEVADEAEEGEKGSKGEGEKGSVSEPTSPVITKTPLATPTVVTDAAIPVATLIPVATALPHSSSPLPPFSPSSPGRRIGDFELLSILGEGGMGIVYRAKQISLGRQVALKCLHPGGNKDRFAREIKALGRVKHPNLVEIFTSGSDGEQWFYAMELLDGATLSSVSSQLEAHLPTASELTLKTWDESVKSACEKSRRAEKSLSTGSQPMATGSGDPPKVGTDPNPAREVVKRPLAKLTGMDYIRRVVELICQVADALQGLHKINVIHRDVKPSNIMVTPDGSHAVLMDLGLAKHVDASRGDLTKSRQFVGTLRYASPEQVHFADTIDARTDIYSLGATLWEMLTFRPMHGATENTSPFEVEKRILFSDVESAGKHNRNVPADLDAIVARCLEKAPTDRYATAQDLAADLHRFLQGEPIPTSKKTIGRRMHGVWRSVKRHRTLVGVGLLLLILAVAGGVSYRIWNQSLRVHVEQFANFTKQFGAPRGIGPLSDAQVARRNYSYKLFSRGGRVEKIEVVNGGGKLTARHNFGPLLDRSDATARECRYDFKYDADGNVTAEYAFDRVGDVVWIFKYTAVGNKFNTAGFYTDKDGNIRPRTSSGATKLSFTWNEQGYLAEVRYFDVQNRPQPDPQGSFGIQFDRDSSGLAVQTTQLDSEGKPANNRLGYCKVKNRYDANANVVEASYLDPNGNPTRNKNGYGRRKLDYDEYGNQINQSFWNADGTKPAWHVDGYHSTTRKYDAAGLEIAISYFGEDNKPVVRKGGYHRVEYVNNEFDEAIEGAYFGVDNASTRGKDGYARWTAKFDPHGNRIEVGYFDEELQPTHQLDGSYGWKADYDSRGNQTKVAYLDGAGKFLSIYYGYAYRENNFDEHGNAISTAYFDEHGQPTALRSETYLKIARKFDDRGNNIEETYLDEQGKLVNNKDGYCKLVTAFDEHGLSISSAYFDANDRSVRSALYKANKIVAKRDRTGWLIERRWLNEHDQIEESIGSYEKYFNDNWGNVLELTFWTANDKPDPRGYARRTDIFDEQGNRVQESYYNAAGNAFQLSAGYARMNTTYDRRGNALEKSYYDALGNPVRRKDGGFKLVQSYDNYDNPLRISHLNAQGKAMQQSNNVATTTFEYDRWNNPISKNFFDELGRPVRDKFYKYAGWKDKFNSFGMCVERRLLDEAGKPATHLDRFCRWQARFDRFSQMIEVSYFDLKDKLVVNQSLNYAHAKWVYGKNRCTDASFFDEFDQPVTGRVVVTAVTFGSLAERLGIKVNDVLFSYRGQELHFLGKFRGLRADAKNDKAANELVIYREGQAAGQFLEMQMSANEADGLELEDRAGPPIRRQRVRENDP